MQPIVQERKPTTPSLSDIGIGMRESVPVALSVFAYGLVFGVLGRQTGLSVGETVLMSIMVFAGSAEFVALGMWATPIPIAGIVITTLVVNLRHVLMGAVLSPHLRSLPRPLAYAAAFLLTDESWALTMGAVGKGRGSAGYFIGSGLTIYMAWVGATAVGRLLGGTIRDPAHWGLDFAFTTVVIALLAGMWKGKSDALPWAVAAGVAVATHAVLPGKWYIVLGGGFGSVVGALCRAD
jgi:4-azaleucine resistance transporter AzlC